MIPSRYTNLGPARARFGDRVDRLAPFLLRTDPLADAAIEAMAGIERGGGFALLDRMLERSEVDPAAPPAMRAYIEETARVPAWVDWPTIDGLALLDNVVAEARCVLVSAKVMAGLAPAALAVTL